MGVKLKELVERHEITLEALKGKTLAVDAFNYLYQFLTTIRQPDGEPLRDSKGQITSHLAGLFNRTTKLMQKGIKLVFVFDGTPPALKSQVAAARAQIKHKAQEQYEIARETGSVEDMRKYAARTASLTPEMVDESKELITALGLPVIQAPSEGEAQAAHLAKKSEAWAVASSDFDSLLFGAPRFVRNLSIEGRRKLPGKFAYVSVKPEVIQLDEMLNTLGINQDQLLVLGILVGTDYNPGGIHGIGPKKALALVKKYKSFEDIFTEVKWNEEYTVSWKEILNTFKTMPVTDDYSLAFRGVDHKKVEDILVTRHGFSLERIQAQLEKMGAKSKAKEQKGLGDFFPK